MPWKDPKKCCHTSALKSFQAAHNRVGLNFIHSCNQTRYKKAIPTPGSRINDYNNYVMNGDTGAGTIFLLDSDGVFGLCCNMKQKIDNAFKKRDREAAAMNGAIRDRPGDLGGGSVARPNPPHGGGVATLNNVDPPAVNITSTRTIPGGGLTDPGKSIIVASTSSTTNTSTRSSIIPAGQTNTNTTSMSVIRAGNNLNCAGVTATNNTNSASNPGTAISAASSSSSQTSRTVAGSNKERALMSLRNNNNSTSASIIREGNTNTTRRSIILAGHTNTNTTSASSTRTNSSANTNNTTSSSSTSNNNNNTSTNTLTTAAAAISSRLRKQRCTAISSASSLSSTSTRTVLRSLRNNKPASSLFPVKKILRGVSSSSTARRNKHVSSISRTRNSSTTRKENEQSDMDISFDSSTVDAVPDEVSSRTDLMAATTLIRKTYHPIPELYILDHELKTTKQRDPDSVSGIVLPVFDKRLLKVIIFKGNPLCIFYDHYAWKVYGKEKTKRTKGIWEYKDEYKDDTIYWIEKYRLELQEASDEIDINIDIEACSDTNETTTSTIVFEDNEAITDDLVREYKIIYKKLETLLMEVEGTDGFTLRRFWCYVYKFQCTDPKYTGNNSRAGGLDTIHYRGCGRCDGCWNRFATGLFSVFAYQSAQDMIALPHLYYLFHYDPYFSKLTFNDWCNCNVH